MYLCESCLLSITHTSSPFIEYLVTSPLNDLRQNGVEADVNREHSTPAKWVVEVVGLSSVLTISDALAYRKEYGSFEAGLQIWLNEQFTGWFAETVEYYS